MKRTATHVAAAVGLLLCTGTAQPIGFGRSANHHAVLGRPVDLSVPLRVEPGESIDESCLSAVVMYGDTRVPPQEVRLDLDRNSATDRIVRIRTATPIDEPVVTVTLGAGCDAKISRKLVVFADPPTVRPAADDPVALPSASTLASRPPVGGSTPREAEPVSVAAAPEREPITASRDTAGARSAAKSGAGGKAAAAGTRRAQTRTARPAARAPEATVAAAVTPRVPMQSARITPEPEAASGARLMLDPIEADALMVPNLRVTNTVTTPDENATARRATAAALWRTLNASPEELALQQERLAKLESDLSRLRQESVAAQATVATLQTRLRESQRNQYFNPLVYGLGALSLGLAGAIGYLLWRRREAARAAWWESAMPAAAPAPQTPDHDATRSVVYEAESASVLADHGELREGVVVSESPEFGAHAGIGGQVSDGGTVVRREVSVDELIDLEQQVDFFLVLGQEEAAIDLLMSHVRSTAGSSPLPYLKLLEIYQKRGARDEYEDIRDRFNERFNAYAPDWDADLSRGHTLAEYPQVIERLEHLWSTPARALEVIQASLLRRDGDVTFDLPAYRELLFLYGVARDLVERGEPMPGEPVDVELPLDDDAPPSFSPTMVQPLLATMPLHVQVDGARTPSLSVDLELDPQMEPMPEVGGKVSNSGSIDFDPLDIQVPPSRS